MIETLDNDHGESNHSAIECCLFIGNQSKEFDYKYDQLVRTDLLNIPDFDHRSIFQVELLRIVLTKYKEHEELLTMVLNKYWTTIRVQGNINKVNFKDRDSEESNMGSMV